MLQPTKPLPFAPAHLHPQIIVPLEAGDAEALTGLVSGLTPGSGIDVLEWRVDALAVFQRWAAGQAGAEAAFAIERAACLRVFESTGLPVLATIRTGAEGGPVPVPDPVYDTAVTGLIESATPTPTHGLRVVPEHRTGAGPEFGAGLCAVDVEFHRAPAAGLLQAAADRGVAAVASFHDFESTPDAQFLSGLLRAMEHSGAAVAKFAVLPHTLQDVLRVLEVTARATGRLAPGPNPNRSGAPVQAAAPESPAASGSLSIPVIAIAMGRLGQITRTAGEFGSAASFASLERASAPGQLGVQQLRSIFAAQGLQD